MNSLNFVAARVSPTTTPAPSRSNSYGTALSLAGAAESRRGSKGNVLLEKEDIAEDPTEEISPDDRFQDSIDEKTPLLGNGVSNQQESKPSRWILIPHRIASSIINSLRWMVSTLVAPGVYLFACLYNENGNFAPFYQIRKLWTKSGTSSKQGLSGTSQALGSSNGRDLGRRGSARTGKRLPFSGSSSSGLSSESESERDLAAEDDGKDGSQQARHTRSKSGQNSDEIAPARRSIRIKLHNEDSVRQRKHRKTPSTSSQSNGSGAIPASDISPATLKSPTSPAASLSLTKYPRAPAPPRPLIPRRQPSYTHPESGNRLSQKTLILDLDETLIHSMAKGGRMSTGHMVEVKLNTFIGVAGQASIGPQHPILYYVHKRPFCDEFLRRVSSIFFLLYQHINLSIVIGVPMVQPCRIHGLGPGVCGPSH